MMKRINDVILPTRGRDIGPNPTFGGTVSDEDLSINQRMARLLVLLTQIDEYAGGLDTVPVPELSEMVSSALGLCGFVDPVETRQVIATVLDAIERGGPISANALSGNPASGDSISADPFPEGSVQRSHPFGSAPLRRD
jgi:hypothetical protein